MLKRIIVVLVASLFVVSAVFFATIYFVTSQTNDGGVGASHAWSRSYLSGYFSEQEKAAILENININLTSLRDYGFEIYHDSFYILKDDGRSLSAISLNFEQVYCQVYIYYSEQEIKWEKEINRTQSWQTIDIADKTFKQSHKTLIYEDWDLGKIYSFSCELGYDVEIYQQFLTLFFKEAA